MYFEVFKVKLKLARSLLKIPRAIASTVGSILRLFVPERFITLLRHEARLLKMRGGKGDGEGGM